MKNVLLKSLVLSAGLVLFCSCSANKKTLAMNSPYYIIVGEGGGFTGAYTQYKIHESGLIEQFDFKEKSYSEIAKLNESVVRPFFTKVEELNLGEMEISSPGNMSQYFEINYKEIKDHHLTWAMRSDAVKPAIQALFDDCFKLCKEQTTE